MGEEKVAPKTLMYVILAIVMFIIILAIFFIIRKRVLG